MTWVSFFNYFLGPLFLSHTHTNTHTLCIELLLFSFTMFFLLLLHFPLFFASISAQPLQENKFVFDLSPPPPREPLYSRRRASIYLLYGVLNKYYNEYTFFCHSIYITRRYQIRNKSGFNV